MSKLHSSLIVALLSLSVWANAQHVARVAGGPVDGQLASKADVAANKIAVTANGTVYIASNYGSLRKIDPASGIITTLKSFANTPRNLAIGPDGSLYYALQSAVVKRQADGTETVVAGDLEATGNSGDNGPAINAKFGSISDIAVGSNGDLFIVDRSYYTIHRVNATTGIINKIAGNGAQVSGGDAGDALSAGMDPFYIALDGTTLYFVEMVNQKIRKINLSTGIVSPVVSIGDGFGGDGGQSTAAIVSYPSDVTIAEGQLYFHDTSNSRIRKIDLTSGVITTFATDGGTVSDVFATSTDLFIADNGRIRKITSGGQTYPDHFTRISATNGVAVSLSVSAQFGIASAPIGDLDDDGVDDIGVGATNQDGNLVGAVIILYMNADGTVKSSVKVSSTDSPFDEDSFGSAICGLGDLDKDGVEDIGVGAGYDSDGQFHAGAFWILFMNKNGTVKSRQKISSTAGNFSAPLSSNYVFGTGAATIGDLDNDGNLEIAVGARGPGQVYILFLNTNGTVKSYKTVTGLSIDPSGLVGYGVAGLGDVDKDGVPDLAIGGHRSDVNFEDSGAVFVVFLNADGTTKGNTRISSGHANFNDATASFLGVAIAGIGDFDGDGVRDMVVGGDDSFANKGTIWYMLLKTDGTVKSYQKISSTSLTLDAGDFFGGSLSYMGDMDGDGNGELAVGAFGDDDGGSNKGAMWISSGGTGLLYGNGGFSGDGELSTSASLGRSNSITTASSGDIYFVDASNARVRKIANTSNIVSTVAGTGVRGFSGDGGPATNAKLDLITSCVIDNDGNLIISANNRIRKVNLTTGVITTIAGTGSAGYTGDGGPALSATLRNAESLAVDAAGNIYFFDSGNMVIRKIANTTNVISTYAGNGSAGDSGNDGPATSAQFQNVI
ncbi:MAG TPA: FG-GAP-like repeat-containing protein, partial [Cyclobacteriaceae bacterium]|nr:FG-GAP-like repeat-containing protein [Cyclobacteriaceae bacterium]